MKNISLLVGLLLSVSAVAGGVNNPGGSGTVTSVSQTTPVELCISGSPVTTSGTLALTWCSDSGAKFIATPSGGGSGAYSGRAIVASDIPTLNQSTSGNAATATALAANPTDCSSNLYANAIDASGNLTCAAISSAQVSGLGTAATQNTGTSGATLPFLNGANTFSGVNSFIISGDVGLIFRELVGTTTFGAIYSSAVTPSSTNYAVAASSTQTNVNAVTSVGIATGGTSRIIATSTGAAITGLLSSTNGLTIANHTAFTGTAPTVTACGTSAAIDATASDTAGTVTEGTIATGCTITFAGTYTTAAHCNVTSQAGLVFSYTESATAIVVTNIGALSSTSIDYRCSK